MSPCRPAPGSRSPCPSDATRSSSRGRADEASAGLPEAVRTEAVAQEVDPLLPCIAQAGFRAVEAQPRRVTGLPRLRAPLSRRAVPITPVETGSGAFVGCFSKPCCLPHPSAGSASTTSLSRPAQALLALRPVRLGGCQKGTPNKLTTDLRKMILGALNDAGGQKYLLHLAARSGDAVGHAS